MMKRAQERSRKELDDYVGVRGVNMKDGGEMKEEDKILSTPYFDLS